MTCAETRAYFESAAFEDDQSCGGSAEVAEHVRMCAECTRFVGELVELHRQLNLVRDAAPQVSSMLDSAVLANFRKRAAQLTSTRPTQLPKPVIRSAVLWRVAFAAAVLGAVVLSVAYRRPTQHGVVAEASRPVVVPQSTHVVSAPSVVIEVASMRRSSSSHRAKRMTSAPVAAASAVQRGSFPAGFASLMYCDQLSCGEPMEIIRMQLPVSVAGGPSASRRTDSVVYADVLIGSDGVARGIRMVE